MLVGEKVTRRERLVYALLARRISVIFQPKAWVHEAVSLTWLEQFQAETKALGDRLLGFDGHGAQITQAFRALLDEYDIDSIVTPAYCTDVVSPVDHNIGARLKEIMSSYYHAALAANRDNWCNPPSQGGLQAWERRVFLAVWLARAWQQMQADNPTMFRAAFVHTGFLLAADGSEKHLIDIGVYDYNY